MALAPDLNGGDWTDDHAPASSTSPASPLVIDLDDAIATDVSLAGAKAAALARARAAGFTTLPGFVITTAATASLAHGPQRAEPLDEVVKAWEELSDDGGRPLVVRSSSTVEDGGTSSMAGMFRSVLDVQGRDAFLEAVAEVIASGRELPLGVLVQPFLEPAWGGVLFGADPVTGRRDRLVIAVVPGGPDRLVSGQVDGSLLTLSPRGRVLGADGDVPRELLQRGRRLQLVRLARRAAQEFGGPQDIEWAATHDGRIVMLQSRPITALGSEAHGVGPLFGPGPVAETFPVALHPLEEDLWLTPLRDALRHTLGLTGSTSRRRLRESPLVVSVQGRVAVDLDALGLAPVRRRLLAKLDPRPPMRRLRSAWRIGRLRSALPALALDMIRDVDRDLASIPALDELTPGELVRVLRRSHDVLVALHGYEVLAGQLLEPGDEPITAASVALRVLAEAGPDVDPDELVETEPVVLALTPPAIRESTTLPPAPRVATPARSTPANAELVVREALRLRIRWTHELTARAALALGRELVRRGVLTDAVAVRCLRLDELDLVLGGGPVPNRTSEPTQPPLPATFRFSDSGAVVPVAEPQSADARGAGGGRGSGPVFQGDGTPPAGAVLVVRNLDPGLAGVLPGLGGLVAETGSVLSHLAILAREYGVPTVVGVAGAVDRFVPGQWVVVDGDRGEVVPADSEEWRAA